MKTRIQAASEGEGKKLGIKAILLRILKEEGIPGYYRGFVATMLNTFSMRESPSVILTLASLRELNIADCCAS